MAAKPLPLKKKVPATKKKEKGASHQIWVFCWRKKVPATKSGYSADLKRLQDELLRARIDRARQLTEDQRLFKVFDLTNSALVRMHEGAMAELDAANPAIGWREVRRRLERLRRARVRNVVPPVGPPANSRSVPQ